VRIIFEGGNAEGRMLGGDGGSQRRRFHLLAD
jgi:hypothetical protein